MITAADIVTAVKTIQKSMDVETRDEWVQRNQIDDEALHTLALSSPDPTSFLAGFNFGFELAQLVTLREAEAPLEDS